MNVLVSFVVALVVVGLILYIVNNFFPLDPKVKHLINVVVWALLGLWGILLLLQFLGWSGPIGNVNLR